ncbi:MULTISPECIES: hypothetical protein [unclassified Curtobacterium]|uniref:hypothetical protein n=1 Tax=unclassified Curtobacterium TaxID=257496 RepID=UPI0008DDE3BE|nr:MULTISPECIES: hypothetical protein [unclassified Curtobacterium]OIH97415.1 hypothetical protein BIU92_15575 [Curtobacterium sp. MCBA15_003]OII10263.1 hypothetical protein BIU97_11870 [Curtobacterium sp. MCBA15_009]OII29415.1 hypothetical protein BIU94_11940 [Curtobacterium sp. MMLR14_006]
MAGIGSWGGGIVLLVAAVLWLVYLMPSWAARRQYLATERNAIRLQQTLRILAQTAELPEEVRVEMNAKSLAEAQRVARSEEAKRTAIVRAHEAARQREITRRLAEQAPVLERASSVPALTAMRMRRSRLGATLLGTVGLVVAVVVLVAAPSLWLVAVAGLVAAGGSAAVLAQLHQVATARKQRIATAEAGASRASRPATAWTDPAPPLSTEQPAEPAQDRSWTPNRVPKPLYVERPSAPAPSPESSAELAARLKERVAAAKAEAEAEAAAIRAGDADPSLARVSRMRPELEDAAASLSAHDQGRLAERLGLRAPAVPELVAEEPSAPTGPPAPPSKWAGMGVIDDDAYQQADLDAIMRRRRAV